MLFLSVLAVQYVVILFTWLCITSVVADNTQENVEYIKEVL